MSTSNKPGPEGLGARSRGRPKTKSEIWLYVVWKEVRTKIEMGLAVNEVDACGLVDLSGSVRWFYIGETGERVPGPRGSTVLDWYNDAKRLRKQPGTRLSRDCAFFDDYYAPKLRHFAATRELSADVYREIDRSTPPSGLTRTVYETARAEFRRIEALPVPPPRKRGRRSRTDEGKD